MDGWIGQYRKSSDYALLEHPFDRYNDAIERMF